MALKKFQACQNGNGRWYSTNLSYNLIPVCSYYQITLRVVVAECIVNIKHTFLAFTVKGDYIFNHWSVQFEFYLQP